MGSSRRQRAKNEGTFLESVKDSLHALRLDLDAIKRILEQHPAFNSKQPDTMSWVPFPLQSLSHSEGEADDWNWRGVWESVSFDQGAFGQSTAWTFPGIQVENEMHDSDQVIPARLSREELLKYHMQSSSQTVPEELEHLHSHMVALDLRTWQPADRDVFESGSALGFQLQSEAATVIQSWFRAGESSTMGKYDEDATEDDESADSDEDCQLDRDNDNSAEAVAVRRAFMTSVASVVQKTLASQSNAEVWSYAQILEWIGPAMDIAVSLECRESGAKAFWKEWAKVEKNVPNKMRSDIVKFMDAKLSARGFPSLRELVVG